MPISSLQYLSSWFLKALVDGASTTYCGSRFQSTTTLWLKKVRRTRLLFLDWDSFRLCPHRSCPICEFEELSRIDVFLVSDYFIGVLPGGRCDIRPSRIDVDKLQKDLDNLSSWSTKWLLQFNPEKCVVMHAGHNENTRYDLQQDGNKWELRSVTEERDLGVTITSDLKVSRQCLNAVRKANNCTWYGPQTIS